MIPDDDKPDTAPSTPTPSGSSSSSSTSTDSDGTNEHTSTGPTPAPAAGPSDGQLSPTNAEPGEGQTGVVGGNRDKDADLEAANQHIEVAGDPEGQVTNREAGQGTLQREPTPEELPSDAKIAPLAEQVNPNGASQAVGAADQPEEIQGVEQPKEGLKNLPADGDTADAAQYLPENSEQHEDAERAQEDAERDADRGRL